MIHMKSSRIAIIHFPPPSMPPEIKTLKYNAILLKRSQEILTYGHYVCVCVCMAHIVVVRQMISHRFYNNKQYINSQRKPKRSGFCASQVDCLSVWRNCSYVRFENYILENADDRLAAQP